MARRRNKIAADQQALDFEGPASERHAHLMVALKLTGRVKYTPLARLVFNMQERADGRPLGWTGDQIGDALGISRRSVFNWTVHLEGAQILSVNYRPRARGGCQSNLLAINWEGVRSIIVNRPEAVWSQNDRPANLAERPATFAKRPAKIAGPYKDIPSSNHSLNPSSPKPPADWREVEEEIFQLGVNAAGDACRGARDHGATVDEVRAIGRYWLQHRVGWDYAEYVLYVRIKRATPGTPADECWPAFTKDYERQQERERHDAQTTAAMLDRRRQRTEVAPFDTLAALEEGEQTDFTRALRTKLRREVAHGTG